MSSTETSSTRSPAVLLALILLACALSAPLPAVAQTSAEGEPTPARLLAAAKSWGVQLHKLDPDTLAAAPYDMLVIDYSRDGKAALALTPEQVNKIRIKPDGERRIVLAYLSIGEAETYRYYWKWYWRWFFGVFAPRWLAGKTRNGLETTAYDTGRKAGKRSSSGARTDTLSALSKPDSTAFISTGSMHTSTWPWKSATLVG